MNKEALKYRYPGARPFTIEQRQIFFGRSKNIEALYELLSLQDLVILYSKSGLGKSSLINAGLVPKIKAKNEFKPLSVRFGPYTKELGETPVKTTSQQLSLNKDGNSYLDKLIPNDDSLWYHIKSNQAEAEDTNTGFTLIFDQFEELFTYPVEEILKFKQALKEILNNQIPQRFREALEQQFNNDNLKLADEELDLLHSNVEVKVLIAIRSDRMSLLNELKDYLPNILRSCYELNALSVDQAEDAILNPALKNNEDFISPPFDYEEEGLKSILKFLTKNYTQKIESFQLQILCQNIEKKVIDRNIQTVSSSDIGDIESIYKNHYDNIIQGIGNDTEQLAARKFMEEGLIFEEEERRLSLYGGQVFKNFGVHPDLLKRLVDSHLLRAEPSIQGGYIYELSHDTLVSPVLEAKKRRISKELRIEQEKALALLEKQKEEARQRENEKAKSARAIRLAILGGVVGVLAILLSLFAFSQKKSAELAKAQAQKQRDLAKELLIAYEQEKIENELLTFENLKIRAETILNVGGCPKELLLDMTSIANNHRDSTSLKGQLKILYDKNDFCNY